MKLQVSEIGQIDQELETEVLRVIDAVDDVARQSAILSVQRITNRRAQAFEKDLLGDFSRLIDGLV